MRRRALHVGLLLLATTWCGCLASGAAAPLPSGPGRHILFVGNSLTYTNDLPGLVSRIAVAAGDSVQVASVTGPNLALIDHLTGSTNAKQVVSEPGWTYVVLQQGPTTTPLCRDSLVLWTRMFDSLIKPAGGQTALFMVWPSPASTGGFDAVHTSFEQAAIAVGGIFLPAGEAWRLAWAQDPNLQLFGPDDFHPSEAGSLAAALEIYERLGGRDVRGLDLSGAGTGLSPTIVSELEAAAHAANAQYPAHPTGALLPPTPIVGIGSC